MTNLYLIRHGETHWNKEQRFQGHTDVPLSDKGLRQASLLGEKLRHLDFSAIYASDLSRAVMTARQTADPLGLPVRTTPDLREIHFGDWEGKSYAEIMAQDPILGRKWFQDPGETSIPGGETNDAIQRRIRVLLDDIAKQHRDETIALFSHGGLIRYMLMEVLELPWKLFWRMEIANTSVTVLKQDRRGYSLSRLNDHSHLEVLNIEKDPLCHSNERRSDRKMVR